MWRSIDIQVGPICFALNKSAIRLLRVVHVAFAVLFSAIFIIILRHYPVVLSCLIYEARQISLIRRGLSIFSLRL